MPKQRPQKSGKRGDDGLFDRARAFAHERRKDPTAPGEVIAKRAGYTGSENALRNRAREAMKKPGVLAIIHAPDPVAERELNDEESLKKEMRQLFLRITRASGASYTDKIKAADKLLSTIAGGYVPVQVDMKNRLTMESIVRAMGGAPDEQQEIPVLTQGADA